MANQACLPLPPGTASVSPHLLAIVAQRLGSGSDATGWTAPPLSDLIARIDDALAARRQRAT